LMNLGHYKRTPEIANHFGLRYYGRVRSAIHCLNRDMQIAIKVERRLDQILKTFDH
jgi:hypothetical protein